MLIKKHIAAAVGRQQGKGTELSWHLRSAEFESGARCLSFVYRTNLSERQACSKVERRCCAERSSRSIRPRLQSTKQVTQGRLSIGDSIPGCRSPSTLEQIGSGTVYSATLERDTVDSATSRWNGGTVYSATCDPA